MSQPLMNVGAKSASQVLRFGLGGTGSSRKIGHIRGARERAFTRLAQTHAHRGAIGKQQIARIAAKHLSRRKG